MLDDALGLDGNAAAGLLAEVFRFEMTTAIVVCGGCGHGAQVGDLRVYTPGTMGTVIRCPRCDRVVLRLAHHSGHYWLDMPTTRHLRIPDQG